MNLLQVSQSLIPLNHPSEQQPSFRCAAVLMPLLKQTNQWQVMLTRRAEHLKHHPGQISFPGGAYEQQDVQLSKTAIRETYEEVGIEPSLIELLGKLPQQQTISQYNITPFVGKIHTGYQLNIDPNEVAEVFHVPLDFLTDLTNYQKVEETHKGQRYHYYVIQYKHYNIWGATARILFNFVTRISR